MTGPVLGKEVPVLADLKPSGKHVMWELVQIGGIMPMMKMLLGRRSPAWRLFDRKRENLKQNLAKVKDYPKGQTIIRGFKDPIKASSHLVVLYGNCSGRCGSENLRQRRTPFRGQGASVRIRRKGSASDPG